MNKLNHVIAEHGFERYLPFWGECPDTLGRVPQSPFEGIFFGVKMKLSEKFPVRLTKEDYDLLHSLAEKIEVKPGQLARYAIRKLLHQSIKEDPFLMEG